MRDARIRLVPEQIHDPTAPIGLSESRAVDRVLRAAVHVARGRRGWRSALALAHAIAWLRAGYP